MLGRSVRTSQPQGPARVDWSNPITRGLVFAHNPTTSNNSVTQALISGASAKSATSAGIFIGGVSTSSTSVGAGPVSTGNTWTVFVDIECRANPNGFGGRFFRQAGNNDGRHNIFAGGATGSQTVSVAVNYSTIFSAPLAEGSLSRCVIRHQASNHSLWVNGSQSGISSNASAWAIGVNSGNSAASNAIGLQLIFNRALSDAEIKSLSDNPWQIFAPDSKSLWVPAAVSVTLPTLVQPNSTTSAGAWTATGAASLHDAINETVASDTQYISVNSASTTELVLAEAAFPGGVAQAAYYDAFSADSAQLTLVFKQGGTQISTRTHQLTPTNTRYSTIFTPAEIAVVVAGPISVAITSS